MVSIGDRRGTVVCDTTVPSRSMCTASSDIVQRGQRVHKPFQIHDSDTIPQPLACKILTSLIVGEWLAGTGRCPLAGGVKCGSGHLTIPPLFNPLMLPILGFFSCRSAD